MSPILNYTLFPSSLLGFWIISAVKVALIIVYYFNAMDNPKAQSKLVGRSV